MNGSFAKTCLQSRDVSVASEVNIGPYLLDDLTNYNWTLLGKLGCGKSLVLEGELIAWINLELLLVGELRHRWFRQ